MCFKCVKELAKPDVISLDDVVKEFIDKGLKFNTRGEYDIQIYNGKEKIFHGVVPGIFKL